MLVMTVWPCLWERWDCDWDLGAKARNVSSAAEPALTLACLKPNLINKNLVKPYTFKAHTPPTLLVRKYNLKCEKLRKAEASPIVRLHYPLPIAVSPRLGIEELRPVPHEVIEVRLALRHKPEPLYVESKVALTHALV